MDAERVISGEGGEEAQGVPRWGPTSSQGLGFWIMYNVQLNDSPARAGLGKSGGRESRE